jgi:hypothetical protein
MMAVEDVFLAVLIIAVVFFGAFGVLALIGSQTAQGQQTQASGPLQATTTYSAQPATYAVADSSGCNRQTNDLRAQLYQAQADMQNYKRLYEGCQQPSYNYVTQRYIDYVVEGRQNSRHSYDLTITVKDSHGDAIEDAYVRVRNTDSESKYSDEDGEARFTNLGEDCYDVTVTKSGYERGTDSVCLEDDERLTIRLASD